MYPIVVRIFDVSLGRGAVMLLKICEPRESTGIANFELLDGELKKGNIMVKLCELCSLQCCSYARFGQGCTKISEGTKSTHLSDWLCLPFDAPSSREGIQAAECEGLPWPPWPLGTDSTDV